VTVLGVNMTSCGSHVRVIYDYLYDVSHDEQHLNSNSVQLCRNDVCLVLDNYHEYWLYVCKVGTSGEPGHCPPMYIPRDYVEPAGDLMSSSPEHFQLQSSSASRDDDDSHQLYASMTRCLSVSEAAQKSLIGSWRSRLYRGQGDSCGNIARRHHAASTPTSSGAVSASDEDMDRVMTCGSVIDEASESDNDNDNNDDDDYDDDDDDDDASNDYVMYLPADRSASSTVASCPKAPLRARFRSADDTQLNADEFKVSACKLLL